MKTIVNTVYIRVASYLRKLVMLKYKLMGVRIEGHVWISNKAHIDTTVRDRITIKDGCVITGGAVILAHDRASFWLRPRDRDDATGFVVLNENVFVGVNAIILRNVAIGRNSIVAAGAVVTKDVPPNTIVGGVPARVIGTVPPFGSELMAGLQPDPDVHRDASALRDSQAVLATTVADPVEGQA
jgi:acetyltransferase-like isoleucine patch superfamily enzyme